MTLAILIEVAVIEKAVPGKTRDQQVNLIPELPFNRKIKIAYLFLGNVQFASNDFCHFQFACMLGKHCCETVQSLLK